MAESDGGASPRLRAIFPWWYLVGAIATAVIIIGVAASSGGSGGSAAVTAFWAPLIGTVIADRRRSHGTTRSSDAGSGERRWWEPVTAAGLTVIAIGVALAAGNLWPTFRLGLFLTGLSLVVAGVLFFVGLLFARRRR